MNSSNTEPAIALRLKQATDTLRLAHAQLADVKRARNEPIAILGMACRFPGGANDPEAYWRLLRDGVDAVTEVPSDRWDIEAYYDSDPSKAGKMSSRWGGFIQDVDRFDAAFFAISPREAARLDPQQRLMLELSLEALEASGQPLDRIAGSATGVFIGAYTNDYQRLQDIATADVYSGTGTSNSLLAGRIAYVFDLQGPAMVLDTVCSSSLVAIHLAVQALRARECDMALVGGVNVMLSPDTSIVGSKLLALAPDGRCKTFDARANGYVRGEGAGVVVLKRLSDAQAAEDPILALVRGSAVNHDGRSTGLTAPNVIAQQRVIRQAMERAGVPPERISYIEAHGTGTSLGDPIEVEALAHVIGGERADALRCALSSVKANIGHLEAAAGIASLIKVVMAMRHRTIAPQVNFERLNPRISLAQTPFFIPTAAEPWKADTRFAGISSFGVSGTNAHVVMEEAPPSTGRTARSQADRARLLTVSARTASGLRTIANAMTEMLRQASPPDIDDVCFTAALRRTHHDHRISVVGRTARELADQLAAAVNVAVPQRPPQRERLIFGFSGQGGQWPGMGRQLLATEPVFRASIEATDRALAPHLGRSVVDALVSDAGALRDIALLQPLLFAIQVGLAALWRSYGIVPDAVVGHSAGEVAAAHVAGILSLEDAAAVICRRSALLARIAGRGGMGLAELPLAEAEAAIRDYEGRLSVAGSNGPTSTVLSGDPDALDAVLRTLTNANVFCRRIDVDVASHSPQVDGLTHELETSLTALQPQAGAITFTSTVVAGPLDGEQLGASYWAKNLREPVMFWPAVRSLLDSLPGSLPGGLSDGGTATFVEIGPHPVLLPGLERAVETEQLAMTLLPSLQRDEDPRAVMLASLGELHRRGRPIDWAAVYPDGGRVVVLPSYPWQRQRYWIEGALPAKPASTPTPSRFYDWLSKVHAVDTEEVYLTYGILPRLVPDFSLALAFAYPEQHQPFAAAARESQRELRRLLFQHVDFDQVKRALDFGCGYGSDVARLAAEHPQLALDGFTISAEQAATGTRKLAALGLAGRARVFHRDSSRNEFASHYELIFGFEVACHIRDKGALFDNLDRHLVDGGQLLLADFVATGLSAIDHDESSSYLVTSATWLDLFRRHHLRLVECIDVSPEVSNVFGDPDPAGSIARIRGDFGDEVASSVHAYVSLGELLNRRLVSYVLLVARKEAATPGDELDAHNAGLLGRPQTYNEALAGETESFEEMPVPSDGPFRDHLLNGAAAAPASALMALLMAAFPPPESLRDIRFPQPLWLSDDRHARLRIRRGAGPAEHLAVESRATSGAPWVAHLVAQPGHDERPTLPAVSIAAEQQACSEVVDGELFYARLAERGVTLGSSLRVLSSINRRDGAAIGTLDPCRIVGAHPTTAAAFDACFQVLGAAVPTTLAEAADVLGVPTGIETLTVDPGAGAITSCLVTIESSSASALLADARLLDADGRTALRLAGLKLERVPAAHLAPPIPADWFYTVEWRRQERTNDTPVVPGSFLIFADRGGVGAALATELAQRGHQAVLIEPGDDRAGPSLPPGIGTEPIRGVIFLHGLDAHLDDDAEAVLDAATTLCRSASALTREIRQHAPDARLWIVTAAAQSVSGEQVEPAGAVLWGLGRGLALEASAVWGGLVDLPAGGADVSDLCDEILDSRAGQEDQVALRAHGRFVARLARCADIGTTVSVALPLNADASYLVSGGLGVLGLRVARWLVAHGARHVVLIGRRAPTAEVAAELALLRLSAVNVVTIAADIADETALGEAFARFGVDLPRLAGILHLASDMTAVPLDLLDEHAIRTMLRAKLAGAWALHRASERYTLDFFVMFGSTTGVWGSAGLAHYAAANTFLDALAIHRRTLGQPALSIDWGTWEGSLGDEARVRTTGLHPLPTHGALRALERLIVLDRSGIAVAAVDWSTLKPLLEGTRAPSFLAELGTSDGAGAALVLELAAMPQGRRRALIERDVRDAVAAVLGFAPDEIEGDLGFFQMGMDSITSLQVRQRLEQRLGLQLPATLIFNHPSVDALTEQIDAQLAEHIMALAPADTAASEDEGVDDLLDRLEQGLERL